ncbi:hypothetical protein KDA_21140 [Dictyobacter alpinus]|uniref:CheW-like domain-containing protein n=1 Tax=Dictyobacter alpinus TaxID=2014873 RepID=A0A402B5M1_9CHLR|nr:chemotaxis protein CheW [Dictyobacter alpinus]GCE26630.1 hypothetical protein KDA_21140 [Dictyobacter alpinus]
MSQHPVLPTTVLSHSHADYLERLSDQEFWQHAVQLAKTPLEPTIKTKEYLECELNNGSAMIQLDVLREVLPSTRAFAQLPQSPPWMLGVTAWRGEMIAVIDLAAYLTQQQVYIHENRILFIVQTADITLGLAVTIKDTRTTIPIEFIQSMSPVHDEECATPEGTIQGTYAGVPILNIPMIVTNVVQQLSRCHE